MSGQHPDRGFTLVEVLLVILVLGLLAAIVIAAVGGMTAKAEATSCETERRTLNTAVEAYFAQRDTTTLVAADATPGGHERTLVEAGFLRMQSRLYDLDASGALVLVPGSSCGLDD